MSQNHLVKSWHVAYTFPKAEKKVHTTLEKMGVTSFLPMQTLFRKWSDRMKKITTPLFPNYIFVNISSTERYQLTKVDGFIRYVTFEGKPSTVSDKEIDSLKKMLDGDIEIANNDQFDKNGMPVLITQGPFAGIEGILVRKDSRTRLVVNIWALRQSVSINVPASAVTALTAQ